MQNRPEARNAQNAQLTYDLNDCFDLAMQDESVKVILFGGEGHALEVLAEAGEGRVQAGGFESGCVEAVAGSEFAQQAVELFELRGGRNHRS